MHPEAGTLLKTVPAPVQPGDVKAVTVKTGAVALAELVTLSRPLMPSVAWVVQMGALGGPATPTMLTAPGANGLLALPREAGQVWLAMPVTRRVGERSA